MGRYVLGFEAIDATQVALVGGKGASLGELSRIAGVRVPPGFCVTTDAFERAVADHPAIADGVEQLSLLRADDREAIRTLGVQLRHAIGTIAIPGDIAGEIARALAALGAADGGDGVAVRSSATSEDAPATSFAGLHESYLNVVGRDAVLEHVRHCWAALFTDRAVAYRIRQGVDHRAVRMAVVVQRMILPDVAGLLFTADPVTGNRRVSTVEASVGLGEALVGGRVNGDVYHVRDGDVIARSTGTPTLSDARVLALAALGRRIEAHFGRAQDIEWCLAGDDVHVVQGRPITTLFPIPAADDDAPHVYLSVGHQQMMTDAMKPLGISFWQMTAFRPMHEAGGRLFVDVTSQLASPASRAALMEMIGKGDPLTGDALRTIVEREGFLPPVSGTPAPGVAAATPAAPGAPAPLPTDPAIVTGLMEEVQASLATLGASIRGTSGPALLDLIQADIPELKRILFDPRSHRVFMSAMEATAWLNARLHEWLGESNAADVLTQSVANNVTSEMGLALLDVADVIRPYAEVIAFLDRVQDAPFLDELPRLPGGREARDAIQGWLDRYGMRCAGEIDITRPRWSERPADLLPLILANVRNFAPGEGRRRFARGREEAARKERALLARLRALPDGEARAAEVKRMIDRVRTFIGYREYPKYGMVSRYFIYRLALLDEAARLVRAGVLDEVDDVAYLTFQELREVVRTQSVHRALIQERKEAFRWHQALTPPRVLTSEGESVHGSYRRDDLPAGALVGLAVSAGTVDGRARVLLDMAAADLEPGDILVTRFTDPSWTPLFLSVAGLVTGVGGLMTHGAVIAREYGLPAVVGVEDATRRIPDGARIRVHGAEGYVEILGEGDPA